MNIALVWFRQDLRIHDNQALYYARQHADAVIGVFIDDPEPQSISRIGAASRVWLHHSLGALEQDLQAIGIPLVFMQGESLKCLLSLIKQSQSSLVCWNRCYEPNIRQRDERIKSSLKPVVSAKSFKGNVLFEPWEVVKQNGEPYKVFTPYWNAIKRGLLIHKPLPAPSPVTRPISYPQGLTLADLQLLAPLNEKSWDTTMMAHWQVGETAAAHRLETFLVDHARDYHNLRDYPAIAATSQLSPHLHFGEISPVQIFYQAANYTAQHAGHEQAVDHLLREVAWREFAYALLYHFPQSVSEPLNSKFAHFPWREDINADLQRWQQGQTGFPLIDAGMRELWHTGWMHNRVRMIVASFLTKNLLIPWQYGEAWFRDTLVDADVASNTMGWQWVAGCGVDAAPYFRIFNPVLQSKKFDVDGQYIKRWVTELSEVDAKAIHDPKPDIAKACGYVESMVDLKQTREQALSAYQQIK